MLNNPQQIITVTDCFVIIESVATTIGIILALFGLFYTARQLEASQKTARGEFLLHLDELFYQHDKVHRLLRPGGDWADGESGPVTNDDWILVEKYMGLFERVKVLVDDGLIDIDTVYKLYGYRVFNIVDNEIICQRKLDEEANSWGKFIELRDDLKAINR